MKMKRLLLKLAAQLRNLKIPNINCACGRVLKSKRGMTLIVCPCGHTYRLYKSRRDLKAGEVVTKTDVEVVRPSR